ncbi:MAG: hypothetical protein V4466_01190 [Pseudomonadota bacterium]
MTLAAARLAPDMPHGLLDSLEGVAQELRLLQDQMLRIQDVCHAPESGVPLDPALVRELQGLDLVSQRLEALSEFVMAVVGVAPFDPAVDLRAALDAIPLRDLAHRLASHATGLGALEQAGDNAGDFDLF